MTLLVAYGTRPEHLKIEPLLKYWKSIGFNEWKVYLTFQHNEFCQNVINTWEFDKNQLATSLEIPSKSKNYNRLDDIVTEILLSANDPYCLGYEFGTEKYQGQNITAILVQGDTASAFACALAAFHRQIPIIHLEAGLRSYNNTSPYPEEMYRRCISNMASIHLCPTKENLENLKNEKINTNNCFVVGNTILDPLKNIQPSIQNKILVTLHRRENQSAMEEWFKTIEYLAEKYQNFEFLLPIHKNPEVYKHKSLFKYVKCVDPLNHDELINYLANVNCVITDSGGIVEEATWFKKPIFLCRTATERPEAFMFYQYTPNPNELVKIFSDYMTIISKHECNCYLNYECPFGDGNACIKITNVLRNVLNN